MDAVKAAELKRLEKLTVTKLREEALAKFHDELKGVHGISKPELLKAMCQLMDIPYDEEEKARKQKRVKKTHDKKKIKAQIKALKSEREKIEDKKKIMIVKKRIKHLKRILRRESFVHPKAAGESAAPKSASEATA